MWGGMTQVAIFGGAGFIGTHLAQHIIRSRPDLGVSIIDINPPRNANYALDLHRAVSERVRFVQHDVRRPIPDGICGDPVTVIYNLAAVHREPGHKHYEYFETNLLGAENVCDWATRQECKRVVFTSSIAPYGASEERKTECSLPTPETAYGSSKLVAEKIHLAWQAADASRKVLILRPGVVFGSGEGGNVTRLLRSVIRGYFAYMGNRKTRKAAGYVKELCHVMDFGLRVLNEDKKSSLVLNFSLDPVPTVEGFVNAIQRAANLRRTVLSVPRAMLVGGSYPIAAAANLIGLSQPINPVRIRKLFRSTNIEPWMLKQLGYQYRYTLESAFADWKADAPEDFER